MKNLWSISVLTQYQTGTFTVHRHCAGTVEAQNKDEAYGKAWQIAQKAYPTSLGYSSHHVMVESAEKLISLDNIRPIEPTKFGNK